MMHLTEPVFLMTSDQDWAPNWAIESLLSATEGIPLHFFRTNPCTILDDAFSSGKITQGWHPNLLPNSSHGSSQEEVINYMKDNFPLCNTVRSHAFNTNTHFDRLLFEAGIRVDSQQATLWQSNLSPILDISGIIRLPVYFEDDPGTIGNCAICNKRGCFHRCVDCGMLTHMGCLGSTFQCPRCSKSTLAEFEAAKHGGLRRHKYEKV